MTMSSSCPLPHNSSTSELLRIVRLYNPPSPLLPSYCNCSTLGQYVESEYSVFLYCSPFPFAHSLFSQLLYGILFTSTILLALVGNITVMWIVLRHRSMRTVTNYYLLNLAVADASISIFNTGFSWSYNFYYIWIFGSFYCRVNNLMGITPICASVFTMIVMSIDRYWAIVHPLRRRPGKKPTVAVISLIWVLAILCGIPAFLISKIELNYFYDGENLFEDPLCLADNYPDGTSDTSLLATIYNNGLVTVQYLVPLCVLCCAYYRVGHVLRKEDKSLSNHSRHARSIKAKKKAAYMLALVVFIFMIVWLPYNAYFLLSGIIPVPENKITSLFIYINIYWLGMSSTVFNPIIYYFMNKRFRVGFRHAFRWIPFVRSNRGDYIAILSSNNRPSLTPTQTANTDF